MNEELKDEIEAIRNAYPGKRVPFSDALEIIKIKRLGSIAKSLNELSYVLTDERFINAITS